MTDRSHGIAPDELADDDLRREVAHLHETRHDTLLGGSESALTAHTERMLALEREFLRRFPEDSAPDPQRTRAGSREEAGQPVPGRDLGGSPY
ncbi:DUF6158 family protein [Pseudonocardia sp. MH-G8]|uniref:DUF6158 family protein n=1 Tax=Pseudonocardia sp. MH-G8 TaxID=1854588 RepID=UPI000BA0836A|nr:DUF6158 family protein [Pseudonocardia sp. MH-G8]OZM81258.1 hypothetical protein CFP66_16480 [Pseudonocardia sp. MH-G8]